MVLVAAACGSGGGGETKTVTVTETVTTPTVGTTTFRVYFLHGGKLQPVARSVPETQFVVTATLAALVGGPSQSERELGLTSAIPSDWKHALQQHVSEATVDGTSDLSAAAKAQLVYTLTQFSSIRRVGLDGESRIRADFENETPIILVESPLPFEKVRSPLRATGTANTFEATFNYDLVGPDGKVIANHFVTATSGSGTRGTFDFTVPFTVSQSGPGKLVVYELSAKDGSRIHQVEIPLTLEP